MSKFKTYAPICLFVWKKYHLFDQIFKKLKKTNGFKKSKVFIFQDGFTDIKLKILIF